jgi:hypothetical protein
MTMDMLVPDLNISMEDRILLLVELECISVEYRSIMQEKSLGPEVDTQYLSIIDMCLLGYSDEESIPTEHHIGTLLDRLLEPLDCWSA